MFCSSVLFGIKMDVIDLLMVWWWLVLYLLKWKSAFKQKLKGAAEPLSGISWARGVEGGGLIGIPFRGGFLKSLLAGFWRMSM